MTSAEKLIQGLNIIRPDWWHKFADHQDMRDFARDVESYGLPNARERLQRCVASELLDVVRGAVEAGLVTFVKED